MKVVRVTASVPMLHSTPGRKRSYGVERQVKLKRRDCVGGAAKLLPDANVSSLRYRDGATGSGYVQFDPASGKFFEGGVHVLPTKLGWVKSATYTLVGSVYSAGAEQCPRCSPQLTSQVPHRR